MAELRVYDLTLRLRSPFMFEGLVNTMAGIDSTYLRDRSGNPVVPATQVKGVMRAALETLSGKAGFPKSHLVKAIFGVDSGTSKHEDEQDRPERGTAIFDDLVAAKRSDSSVIARVAIDDELGVAAEGMLQVLELAAPFAAELDFVGPVRISYTSGEMIEEIERGLRLSLALIPAIGAYKSAGFGEVIAAGCSLKERTAERKLLALSAKPAAAGRLLLDATFDRALVVDSRQISGNVFESSSVVPGAALKGALARKLELAGHDPERDSALSAALEQLSVSHGFPVADEAVAGLPIPLSVMGRQSVHGRSEFAEGLVAGPNGGVLWGDGQPADLVVNGKDSLRDAFRSAFQLPEFDSDKTTRTHVRIGDGFVAADNMLYSTVSTETFGRRWRFSVDASEVSNQDLGLRLVSTLKEGLEGIGRTGASASFVDAAFVQPVPAITAGNVDICLDTPAMLVDPREQKSMAEHYLSYFETVLGVELLDYFARHHLAGRYIAMRRRLFGRETYYPFVLTDAGSVFRLRASDAIAVQRLADAIARGLPPPEMKNIAVSWRNCPYIRQNGYGRIRLHRLDPAKLSSDVRVAESA